MKSVIAFNNLYRHRCLAFIAFLLLSCQPTHAQLALGYVAFDCPNVPAAEFQFDLDKRVIALVTEDPGFKSIPLFKTLEALHLRHYRNRNVDLPEMHRYYREVLTARGWNRLKENLAKTDSELHLYTLRKSGSVFGIFVIVESDGGVYLINIVGEMPAGQVRELLRNLQLLGIEIPELMTLGQLTEVPIVQLPKEQEPSQETEKTAPRKAETGEAAPSSTERTVQPPLGKETRAPSPWNYQGKPIYVLTYVGTREQHATMSKVLSEGSGDIEKVLPVIRTLMHPKPISLRVEGEGTERTAVITVVAPAYRLKSLTISESGTVREQESVDAHLGGNQDREGSPTATRFRTAGALIHELHIRGNQKIEEAHIRKTLNNASPDIEKALDTLFRAMPYFHQVKLDINKEGERRIATITVDEKRLSTDAYLGLNPPFRSGFNRVTGWRIGTGFEVGERKQVGPLWMWSIEEREGNPTSKLFGKVDYAFGNPHLHYWLGGTANWGKPYIWNLGLTAQIHRDTAAIAPEIFPHNNRGLSHFYRVLGGTDFQNYYLRQGVELAVRWTPVMPTHAFKISMVAEMHESLQKSTDWTIANWTSARETRGNPLITAGDMRSLAFQYDFNTRNKSLGWHNTLLVEHSNTAFGSDFDFTRAQLHFRYAFPLGSNRIRTRLLLGYANASLPIQSQFVISGTGGLRGYPLFAPANESERRATSNWYRHSLYAFAGDGGFLFNLEYHYRLSNLFNRDFFNAMFAVLFLDEGQVWHETDKSFRFNPEANIGIGFQFGEDDVVFRLNLATPLRANSPAKERLSTGSGFVITSIWYQDF